MNRGILVAAILGATAFSCSFPLEDCSHQPFMKQRANGVLACTTLSDGAKPQEGLVCYLQCHPGEVDQECRLDPALQFPWLRTDAGAIAVLPDGGVPDAGATMCGSSVPQQPAFAHCWLLGDCTLEK